MHELPQELLTAVRSRLPMDCAPKTGVVLGTGLGQWVEQLSSPTSLEYAELPGFPKSTVESHAGRMVLGHIAGRPILVLQGRFHLYEGYTAEEVCRGVRLLACLGIDKLIITNAAGAINPQFEPGSIMVIEDQINHTGHQPLTGPNIEHWGPRFPDMSQAFDRVLLQSALKTGTELGLRLEKGVYIGVTGPCLETPAETRAYKRWGADAIGMSTVLEIIAAKHMGLNILGLSCLTNANLPDCMAAVSLQDIISRAEKTGQDLGRLLNALIPKIQNPRLDFP